nr:hypothetical protein Iba_chr12aCG13550 [Ipomoea batatas]
MEKELGERFQPKDYELLTISPPFCSWDGIVMTQIFAMKIFEEEIEVYEGSRIKSHGGEESGDHGTVQDKGKPIIDKKTGALFREQNNVADWLAKKALAGSRGLSMLSQPETGILELLVDDSMGVPRQWVVSIVS